MKKKKTFNIISRRTLPKETGNRLAQFANENTENVGNAILSVAQEFLFTLEEILQREWGFTENDLHKLHELLERNLSVVREAEGLGLNAVGIRTIRALADIAEFRKQKEIANRSNIALPMPTKEQLMKKLLEN